MGQNSLTPEENNGLNFQLTCDQATNLETAVNFCASHSHANDFFQILFYFGLGGITKHLMPASMGNSEFYLPLTLSVDGPGEAKLTVSLRASHHSLNQERLMRLVILFH